jgi:hypothetical protein
MKVKIGPYTSDLVPVYRWERNYEMWRSDSMWLDEDDYTWYDKIAFKTFDVLRRVFLPINRWSNSRKRKINVRIDPYDVWSADHTLALIIHPVLVELSKRKQGSPVVDPEDVPEDLRSTEPAGPDNGYTDNTVHQRWEWVMNEMIWAFEQCAEPEKNEDQFTHNSDQLEMKFVSTGDETLDNKGMKSLEFNYQKDPTKPKYWVDKEAKKLHYDRISNGLRLFAKYYFGLWD